MYGKRSAFECKQVDVFVIRIDSYFIIIKSIWLYKLSGFAKYETHSILFAMDTMDFSTKGRVN